MRSLSTSLSRFASADSRRASSNSARNLATSTAEEDALDDVKQDSSLPSLKLASRSVSVFLPTYVAADKRKRVLLALAFLSPSTSPKNPPKPLKGFLRSSCQGSNA